jgi:hyperosmotically inducible periplasmic protein
MMNSSAIPRIVVGVGLVVVFGVGLSMVIVRENHASQVAHNVPAAPLDQSATEVTAPAPGAPLPTLDDPTVSTSSAPPSVPPVVVQAPAAASANSVSQVAAGTTRNGVDTSSLRVATAAHSNRSSTDENVSRISDSARNGNEQALAPPPGDTVSSGSASTTADTQEVAKTTDRAATNNEPVASDSQITADVKSELAAAAPNGNVDVTTTNGVVALAGSVPSQDWVERARQAARRVAGVKFVDVSALTVSNQ